MLDERFAHIFGDGRGEILQSESAALAHHKYSNGYNRMVELSERLHREGTLEPHEYRTLRGSKKFFSEYAETPVEGFANAFALYHEDPEQAERIAPRYCELIFTLIADHPDLQGIVDSLVHAPLGAMPTQRAAKDAG
jgi:hypothetical protein